MLSRRTEVLSGVVVVLSGRVVNFFGHAVVLSGFAASVVLSGHVVILSGRVVNLFGHVVVLSGFVVILSGYAPSERLNCGRTQKISTQALTTTYCQSRRWKRRWKSSVALETFLEEVKFELANIKFNRPKDNLSQGERKALKELSRYKNIVIKKSR